MKPETRARTSTEDTAVKRPVNSSHSVMVVCSGRATVTGGGGGGALAELAAGLPSQAATRQATRSSAPNDTMRAIAFPSRQKPRLPARPGPDAYNSGFQKIDELTKS